MARWEPDGRSLYDAGVNAQRQAVRDPSGYTMDWDPYDRKDPSAYGILVKDGKALGLQVRITRVLSVPPTANTFRAGEYVASFNEQWDSYSEIRGALSLNSPASTGFGFWWLGIRLSRDDERVLGNPNAQAPPPQTTPVPGPIVVNNAPGGFDFREMLLYGMLQDSQESKAAARAKRQREERRAELEEEEYFEELRARRAAQRRQRGY